MRATATFRLLPLFVTLWLVTNATVIAQTRVFGVVRDENSNPIQGASVTAENGDLTFIATTDADGNFGFVTLRQGYWVFTASAPGFTPAQVRRSVRGDVAHLGWTRNLDVNLFLAHGAYGERFGALAHVDSVDLQAQLQAAEELYGTEQYSAAIPVYEELSMLVPALTTLKLKLGDAYLKTEQYAKAQQAYQAILAAEVNLDPSLSRELIYNFGETRLALQGAENAVGWYWRAHETDLAWSKPLLKLGEISLAAGHQAEAQRYLQMAIEAEPGSEAQATASALLARLPPLQ